MRRLFEGNSQPDTSAKGCPNKYCKIKPHNGLMDKLGVLLTNSENDRRVSVDGRLWHAVCWDRQQEKSARRERASAKTQK